MKPTRTRDGTFHRSLLCLGAAGVLIWAPTTASAHTGLPPAKVATTAVTPDRIAADLGPYFEQAAKDGKFAGVVLVAGRDGKVLFERAYGEANRAFNAPNTIDTKFNLGSMNKTFTAVSILQLVERGKVSLDDTVSKILPDYPDQDIARRITVRQLLGHTSGLGNMFNEKYEATPKSKLNTLQDSQALFTGVPLLFEPGTSWSYSNSGYIVLGLIVEKVSGQSYYDYVRDHVFKPAGMTDTDSFRPHDDVPNLAVGYTTEGAYGPPAGAPPSPGVKRTINNSDFIARGTSAGGGYSTVRDLARFAQALMSGRLVGKTYVDLASAGQSTMPSGERYGLGILADRFNGARIIGHGGDAPGVSANLDIFPDSGYVVVTLSNIDGARFIARQRTRALLTGQETPRAITASAEALKALAGMYTLPPPPQGGPARTVEITTEPRGLSVAGRLRKHDFLPMSADEFFDVDNPGARIVFQRDASGSVVGAAVSGVMGPPGTVVKMTRQP